MLLRAQCRFLSVGVRRRHQAVGLTKPRRRGGVAAALAYSSRWAVMLVVATKELRTLQRHSIA